MNLTGQADLIGKIPLFSSLPVTELEYLAKTLLPRVFSTGDLLMREGERDEHFYLLLEGQVEVIKALGTSDERQLAKITGGTLIGEMSLFNPNGMHTASVRAAAPTQALEMTRHSFDALLNRHPALVYALVRQISRRLEESENTTILDLREKNRQLTLAYQELQAAQAELIIKEKLEKELSIARQIQEGILPEELPQLPGWDIAALTVPARAVGGDYYDFIQLSGGQLGLVVGDACDKGIPAALLINLANSLVHVEAPRCTSPEATLRLVNRHLVEMNRSGMFVSLLYGVLDPAGRFDYCRAGHPHPYLLDAQLQPVDPGASPGMPLGIIDEVLLDARTLQIAAGGVLVIFSDGLSEAMDASDQEYGVQSLAAALPALCHLPADQICAELWKQVQEFCGDEPQSDDFTVMVIKREK